MRNTTAQQPHLLFPVATGHGTCLHLHLPAHLPGICLLQPKNLVLSLVLHRPCPALPTRNTERGKTLPRTSAACRGPSISTVGVRGKGLSRVGWSEVDPRTTDTQSFVLRSQRAKQREEGGCVLWGRRHLGKVPYV